MIVYRTWLWKYCEICIVPGFLFGIQKQFRHIWVIYLGPFWISLGEV